MTQNENEKYLSNSLIRGLKILKLFDAEQPTLSLAEIAKELGVSRTVPYRLLYTLQYMGYVDQNEQTKRYELTSKVLELGFSYLNSKHILEIAKPYLEDLRDTTDSSAHLGILNENEVVYVARVPAQGVSTVNVTIGTRLPAHTTAMGKVLLAYQPQELLDEQLSNEQLRSYTSQIETVRTELKKELSLIKKQGYVFNSGEFESGIYSIAAPVFDLSGQIIAAVNIASPKDALTDTFLNNTVIPKVCEVATNLSGISDSNLIYEQG